MMKCKLCSHNLTDEADGEYDDEDLDYEVLEANENGLCRKTTNHQRYLEYK